MVASALMRPVFPSNASSVRTFSRPVPPSYVSSVRTFSRLSLLASAMPPSINLHPTTRECTCMSRQASSKIVAAAAAAAGLAVGDVARDWASEPAESLPSGATMASFLMGYRRVLEDSSNSAEEIFAAVEGAEVLACLRAWLMRHHGHFQHPWSRYPGAHLHRTESAVEKCLWDLEKDITTMLQQDSGPHHQDQHQQRQHLMLQLARLHCTEAASLLRHL